MAGPWNLPEALRSGTPVERAVSAGLVAAGLALALLIVTGVLAPAYLAYLVGLGGMYALMSLGLNVQWGYTGLINFSVAAFFGIGAYGSALMTAGTSPLAGGYTSLVGLGVALVLTAVLAVVMGVATLRLRADYFAIATLGLAEVLRMIARNEAGLTNGTRGLRAVPTFFDGWPVLDGLPAALPGFRIELLPGSPFFLEAPFYRAFLDLAVVLVFLAVSYLVLRRVHRSPWGRTLRAIRSDADLAEALGKNTFRYKMQAFVTGSLVMALAGVFAAHLTRFVGPGTLDPITTFYVWVAVMLGGSGSNRGAVLGGFVIVTIREGSRFLNDYGVVPVDPASLRLLIIGLLIVLVMRFRPAGILPPQKELIWPGTVDEAPSRPTSGVREARGGDADE